MNRNPLVLIVLFTLLWTGTFWHDFFGTELLPKLAHAVGSTVQVDPDMISDVGKLTFHDDSCPPPTHVHSPWLLSRPDSPTAKCQSPPITIAWPLESCCADSPYLVSTAPQSDTSVSSRRTPPQLYIIHRALLI